MPPFKSWLYCLFGDEPGDLFTFSVLSVLVYQMTVVTIQLRPNRVIMGIMQNNIYAPLRIIQCQYLMLLLLYLTIRYKVDIIIIPI